MSIATGLIAKLLLAVSVIPAAGYGGYCAYDHYNPTFHNQLIQQGFFFSPISGDMGSSKDFRKNRGEITQSLGGDWRCTKQLFTDIDAPVANNNGSAEKESNGTVPSTPNINTASNNDAIGCLVADLGYVKDNGKKAGFLKWELALKSGNNGFIYIGYFSIGSSKYTTGAKGVQRQDTEKISSFSTVFEVAKDSETWDIKNGLNWADYFTTTYDNGSASISSVNSFDNAEINVSLANKHEWSSNGQICSLDSSDRNGCGDSRQWEFQRYVGFWEQNNNGDGKQAIDAIKIAAKENKDNQTIEHLHDIWSQTDFDFGTSTQVIKDNQVGKPAWEGSTSSIYDATNKKWKELQHPNQDSKEYLKAIYKPWAKKKGTWMEAEGVCHQSNSRSMKSTDEEAKRLLKFCYKEERK